MKLQRHFAYSYKGKKHYKNAILIPAHILLRLGWKHGQELESEIKGDKLILKVKRSQEEK